MAQALIQIDAVTGSNPPNGTPIDAGAKVQLNNVNAGGEVSYLWEFLDIPAGSSAAFSNPTIQNPTFVADCEGTYLIRLTVNWGLSSESVNTVIAAVLQMKSGIRIPAAGETTEEDTARGWARDTNSTLQLLDGLKASPGLFTGSAAVGLTRGNVVYVSDIATIKAGLPGEEKVPEFSKALAGTEDLTVIPLYAVLGLIDGGTSVTANSLFYAQLSGLLGPIAALGGSANDPVYLSDTGTLSTTPGTYPRLLGYVLYTDGTWDWIYFNGNMVHGQGTLLLGPGAQIAQTDGQLVITNRDSGQNILIETAGGGSVYIVADGTASMSANAASSKTLAVDPTGFVYCMPDMRLKGVDTPTANTDAANKAYVDARSGGIVCWGNSATPNAATQVCLDPGYCDRTAPAAASSHPILRAPKAGTITNLEVYAATGPAGAALDYTLWKNGSATALTCQLAIAGTSASDHTNSVTVVAGDRLELRVKGAGGIVSGAVDTTAAVEFRG